MSHPLSRNFAKIPIALVCDRKLSDKGFRLLSLIRAKAWCGPTSLSHEEIGEALDLCRRQVIRLLRVLEQGGYISVLRIPGQSGAYSLPKEEAPTTDEPNRQPHDVAPIRTMVTCPECGKRRPKLLKVGRCRSCEHQRKLSGLIDEKIEKRLGIR